MDTDRGRGRQRWGEASICSGTSEIASNAREDRGEDGTESGSNQPCLRLDPGLLASRARHSLHTLLGLGAPAEVGLPGNRPELLSPCVCLLSGITCSGASQKPKRKPRRNQPTNHTPAATKKSQLDPFCIRVPAGEAAGGGALWLVVEAAQLGKHRRRFSKERP